MRAGKGWTYEGYKPLIDGRQLPPETRTNYKKHGLRNICLTTIAPTGSIGYIADCSTGIEPHYADKIFRKDEAHPEGVWITTPIAEEYPESLDLIEYAIYDIAINRDSIGFIYKDKDYSCSVENIWGALEGTL